MKESRIRDAMERSASDESFFKSRGQNGEGAAIRGDGNKQDLQAIIRQHKIDAEYLKNKIETLEDSLDVWRKLAKKRRDLIHKLKFRK